MMEEEINEDSVSIFKGISTSFILNNLGKIIHFVSKEVLLYNWLNVTDAANFTVYLGILELFTTFIIISPNVLPKIYTEINRKKIKLTNRTVSLILIPNYLIINILLFLLLSFGINLNLNLDSPVFIVYLITSLGILVSSLTKITESFFYGLKRPIIVGIAKLCYSFSYLLLLLSAMLLNILTFYVATGIFLGSTSFSLAYKLISYKKEMPHSENLSQFEFYDSKIAKRVFIFGIPLFLTAAFELIRFKIAVIVLGGISGTYTIYYHLASELTVYLIILIEFPITRNVQVYFAEYFRRDRQTHITQIYNFIIMFVVLILISFLILFYGLLPLFLRIFYLKYYTLDFINVFKIVLIGGIFYALNFTYAQIIISKGKTNILLVNQFLGALTAIAFISLLLTTNLLILSGFGFSISMLVIFVLNLIFSKKYLTISLKELKIIPILFSIIISISLYEFIYFLSQNIYLSTICSFGSFMILCFSLKVLTPDFVKNLFNFLKIFLANINNKKDNLFEDKMDEK